MNPILKRTELIILVCIPGIVIFLFMVIPDQRFQDNVRNSVAGKVVAIKACALISDEISIDCMVVEPNAKIVESLQSASLTFPSHPVTKTRFMLKVVTINPNDGNEKTSCFVADQFIGTEDRLYLQHIKTEKNCSGASFIFRAGSVGILNFLTPNISQYLLQHSLGCRK